MSRNDGKCEIPPGPNPIHEEDGAAANQASEGVTCGDGELVASDSIRYEVGEKQTETKADSAVLPPSGGNPCQESGVTRSGSSESAEKSTNSDFSREGGAVGSSSIVPPVGGTDSSCKPEVSSTPTHKGCKEFKGIKFVVPNASVGKEFHERVPAQPLANHTDLDPSVELLGVTGYEKSGVEVRIEGLELVLEGTPTISGEMPLQVNYKLPCIPGRPEGVQKPVKVSWFINPDPRNLWNEIEPDQNLPFPKENNHHSRKSGCSSLIAASVRGRSHAHEAKFRDDHFEIDQLESGWNLLVVCDGAGSAKYSREGSKIACQVIKKEIQESFKDARGEGELERCAEHYFDNKSTELENKIKELLYRPLGNPAFNAYKAIEEVAKNTEDAHLNDFATTLIFTIAKNFSKGWFVAAFCIGDGGVGIYSETQGVKVLNSPDGGEFAGQTRFLTMPATISTHAKISARIKFDVCDDMTALLAMTDGVSDAKFETDNEFTQRHAWDQLWMDLGQVVDLDKSNTQAAEQLEEWLQFWSPGNHDDRTLAILLP